MESLLNLPVAHGSTVRLLQITDTHLFATAEESLLGINTYNSYHAVLQSILLQQHPFNLVVATGDLAQDHSLEAYQHFAEGIARLPAPCVWLPGNHDFQPAMVNALAHSGITPSKHVLIGDNWQLILLDTQVFGVPHGQLSDYQLEWLERCLAQYSDRNTLILMHHHPLSSGCTWLDQHNLRNAHVLAALLARYPRVRAILCGHIHQELDIDWNGVRLLASPSTCIQFKPHSTNFAIDDTAPGWRYIDLLPDGTVETDVFRLSNNEFCPDMESNGY